MALEPLLIIYATAAASWLIYKLFFGALKPERHRNMRKLFRNLSFYLIALAIAYAGFQAVLHEVPEYTLLARLLGYWGLLVLFLGAESFVKTCRILIFEYLFYKSMKTGVPVLLVNLFTLLISIVLGAWIVSDVFQIRLTPILATSAALSLVLGLALQDTLGNLFAGVALQLDKPYEIGDWIEVQSGPMKWVGMIQEITWRSTLLIGWSDETVIIPNRIIAGAQVSNFRSTERPICRSVIFKIPHSVRPEAVERALARCLDGERDIVKSPAPIVVVSESHESWVSYKLVYSIEDYGKQFIIADRAIRAGLTALERAKIPTAVQKVEVLGISA